MHRADPNANRLASDPIIDADQGSSGSVIAKA